MTKSVSGSKFKKLKKYFFEFLMVFLAITAGFFSENIRENFGEKDREREYIQSVAEDLRQDIFTLDSIINQRKKKDLMLDSLLILLHSSQLKQRGNEVYYFTRWAPRTYRFFSNDRTLIQLRNSGNWRLIRKHEVSNALQVYDEQVRTINQFIENREESLVIILYSSINKLFDNQIFNQMVVGIGFKKPTTNPPLLSYDKQALNEFANQIHFVKNSNLYFIRNSTTLLGYTKRTLGLIEKDYEATH
jgi:hypothetical protein